MAKVVGKTWTCPVYPPACSLHQQIAAVLPQRRLVIRRPSYADGSYTGVTGGQPCPGGDDWPPFLLRRAGNLRDSAPPADEPKVRHCLSGAPRGPPGTYPALQSAQADLQEAAQRKIADRTTGGTGRPSRIWAILGPRGPSGGRSTRSANHTGTSLPPAWCRKMTVSTRGTCDHGRDFML